MGGAASGETEPLARDLEALRSGAALATLEERSILAVRGEDRASFLQGMLTAEVRKLEAGQGTQALLLSEQGKIVADLRVLVLGEEIWLDVLRIDRTAVRQALERFLVADDVELEERPEYAVALLGPGAARCLARLAPAHAALLVGLAACSHQSIEIEGDPLRAAHLCDLGVEGFLLWTSGDEAATRLAARVREAGALEVGAAALEAARIAGGWARAGVDFDAQTLAPEVPSLARAISYRKGCYLGQEVVERIAARGHVNWTVAALRATGAIAPLPGAAVWQEGRDVGRLTSVTRLPDAVAMLARLRSSAAAPGTVLRVGGAGEAIEARVVDPQVASGGAEA